jgi:pimeloyl-ACP methyl ester carboxylesterase
MTTVTMTERSLRVWHDKVEAKIKVAGSGPPLVFLHGAGGLIWDPFLDGLAERFTVYAPEHPGTSAGNPDAVNPLDDLWDLVLFYYEVFDQLGLRSPAVVGHSFGGMMAAELAATCPERVSQLVLISPIGLWRDDAPVENWMIITPATDLPNYLFSDPQGPAAAQMFAIPEDPEVRVSAQLQLIWSMACTGKFVWPIPDKGLKKRIHRITAPTLIIWGKQDRLVPAVYAQEFADRLPGSRVEVVDAAGHVVQLEQREQVARLISDFLQVSAPT